jgi:hypothetical protein
METELCSSRPEHARRSRWIRPLKVIGPIEPMTDFEWTVYGDVIVSNDIADCFRKEEFSGVQFLPTEFYTSTETPFGRPSLELRVNGWGGYAPAESGIQKIKQCPYCSHKVFSEYTRPEKLFDIESWDGSDFFLIWPLPRYLLVTGRVRDFILDSKYSGVSFKKLGELPRAVAGTLTPGNVRDWFDEDRARTIEGDA